MKITEIISEAGLAGGQGASNPVRAAMAGSRKFQQIFTRIGVRRANTAVKAADWTAKWTSRLGPWMMLLRLLGIAEACYELWNNLGEAEAMYTDGELDQAKLQDFRQFYTGVFIAQVVVPAVIRALANSRYVVWIARLLVKVVTLGSSVATAGASIVALIASEAFFTWLTMWLGSKAAVDWMSNTLMEPLILLGTVPEAAWSSLTSYYEKTDVKRVAGGKPTGKTPGGIGTGVTPLVPPTVIAGVRVSDANGNLMPLAALAPSVQNAIKDPNSAAAKQLAALPKAPEDTATQATTKAGTGYGAQLNPVATMPG